MSERFTTNQEIMDAFITRKKRARDNVPPSTARTQSISPPPKRNAPRSSNQIQAAFVDLTGSGDDEKNVGADGSEVKDTTTRLIPSPFQLNRVEDLPARSNVDTVKLSDILGDPMIKECWLFNYLFEMDFLM